MPYRNLRDYLDELQRRDLLQVVDDRISKDTELVPLVRLQFRGLPEEKRKAFLFENVHDSQGNKYDIPVLVAAMAGSAVSRAANRARSSSCSAYFASGAPEYSTPSFFSSMPTMLAARR